MILKILLLMALREALPGVKTEDEVGDLVRIDHLPEVRKHCLVTSDDNGIAIGLKKT